MVAAIVGSVFAPSTTVAILSFTVTALVVAVVPHEVAGLAALLASSGPALLLEMAKSAALVAFPGVGRADGSRIGRLVR